MKKKKYPLIIGHRGTNLYPENTLLAFKNAIKSGAQVIELDIRLTKDKKIVVFHDGDVETITNGKGLVKHKTLKALKQLRINGEPIASFDEVLAEIRDKCKLIVELKSLGLEKRMVRALKKHDMLHKTTVSCWAHPLVYRLKKKYPALKTAIGIGCFPMDAIDMATKAKADIILSYYEALVAGFHLQKRVVKKAHKNGIKVYSCPVTMHELLNATELKRLLDLGIDGIMVNRPDRLHEFFTLMKHRKISRIRKLISRY